MEIINKSYNEVIEYEMELSRSVPENYVQNRRKISSSTNVLSRLDVR